MRIASPLLWLLASVSLSGIASTAQAEQHPRVNQTSLVKQAVSCASLAKVDLTDIGGQGSRITATSESTSNGETHCVVDGVLAPAIQFKVLLPATTWTQRFLQLGCGGLCGRISLDVGAAAGCAPLNASGFTVATTNMGHESTETNFGDDDQKRRDFAYRGVHLTAVTAKKLMSVFYGRSPSYSYFSGCSDGGREALMEAQRYPEDFNGIIAGAAAMNFQVQNSMYHAWQALSNRDADNKAIIVAADLPLIHKAVIAQCDALDGQTDGLISDPMNCHFNPSVLQCKKGESNSSGTCLSVTQVNTLRKLYAGPRARVTGEKMTVGGPQPGSELSWAGVFVPQNANDTPSSATIALEALKNVIFEKNPGSDYTLKDLSFTTETFAELHALHPLNDATNPDLSDFKAAGGKLIIWHGWSDPHISPLNSIAYHEALGKTLGAVQRNAFERLYLLPGLYHCSGGDGPSLVDFLTPMLNWVEQGVAPGSVVTWQAAQEETSGFGQPTQGDNTQSALKLETISSTAASRPVFPYPYYAVYSGQGDENVASSYVSKPISPLPTSFRWLGKTFYTPYPPMQ
ncbi:tannase/feruloyl esterase family alpha/beta hydrolase [Lonsdalea quercina]|uniref:tannase/feruloyl esterase family alpha/beta hydrolase n=1 Tax=Lonsdalea quercina TaxID=71657 RepID=UPI0039763AD4